LGAADFELLLPAGIDRDLFAGGAIASQQPADSHADGEERREHDQVEGCKLWH